MNKSDIGCLPLILIAVAVLFFIGYMQKVSEGYFLGVVAIAIIAFFFGKESKR